MIIDISGALLIGIAISLTTLMLFSRVGMFLDQKSDNDGLIINTKSKISELRKANPRFFILSLVAFGFLYSISILIIRSFWITMAITVIIPFVPSIADKYNEAAKRRVFLKQFPTVLSQISSIVRTGSSLEEAFSMIAKDAAPPASMEFSTLVSEYKINHNLAACLENLCNRIKSEDLKIFTHSIMISKKTGANIIEQIDNIYSTINQRLYIEGKINALTAQGKIQAVLTIAIPILIILAVRAVDPHYFDPLFDTTLGHIILVIAGLLDSIGFYLVLKLSRVKF
jgi:tight adherence protein B